MNFLRNIRDFILDIPYIFFAHRCDNIYLYDTVEVVLIREYDYELIFEDMSKRMYHYYEYELRSDISLIKYTTVIPIESDYLIIEASKSDRKKPEFSIHNINNFTLKNEEI